MLGKLAGETTVNGVVDWIKERQAWLRCQLNWPKRFPTNSTSSEALARCDAQQIVTAVANVLLKARAVEQCGSEPSRLQAQKQEEALTHVALDGKTLRGTLGHASEGQPKVASVVPLRVSKWDRFDTTSRSQPAKMRSVLLPHWSTRRS